MTGTGSTGFSLRPSRQGGQGPEVQENPPGKVEVVPGKVNVGKNEKEKKVKVVKDIVPDIAGNNSVQYSSGADREKLRGYDSFPLLDCLS